MATIKKPKPTESENQIEVVPQIDKADTKGTKKEAIKVDEEEQEQNKEKGKL